MAKILVVEDEQDNRDLVRFALEFGAHEIVEAVTGEDGLALASESEPDLVLLDISLPGPIDGIEVARKLRLDHHHADGERVREGTHGGARGRVRSLPDQTHHGPRGVHGDRRALRGERPVGD
jgi:CheY-like chemotaxis protein